MKNMFKNVTLGALALTLSIGFAGSALAEDGDVAVEIIPIANGGNVLSVFISDVDLGAYEYSLTDTEATTGQITIDASDLRGTATGWNVTLFGEDFVDDTFELDNLRLTNGTVFTTSNTGQPTEAQPIASDASPVLVSPGSTVLTAANMTGAGTYSVGYLANLTIPAGTLVGEYESTLTVTITGADVVAPPAP